MKLSHPPGTQRAYELGHGWIYTVLPDEYSDYVEIFKERQIELATQESHEEVRELIELHSNRITALTEQIARKLNRE